MSDLLPTTNSTLKPYYQRTGGLFGIVFGVCALGAIGYFLLPILTTIVWNTVNFMIGAAVFLGLSYVILDGKLLKQLFYIYEIAMKKLTGLVIETDPFIIAEMNIRDKDKKREDFKKQQEYVGGEMVKIQDNIKLAEQSLKDAQAKYKKAQELQVKGEDTQSESRLFLVQIGEWTESLNVYKPLYEKLKIVDNHLKMIYKNSGEVIAELRTKLSIQKTRYNTALTASNALKKALSIFSNNPDEQRMLDQANEYIKTEIANNLASLQQNMDLTTDIIRNIDYKKAVDEDNGLRILQDLSQNKSKLLEAHNGVQDIDFKVIEQPKITVRKNLLED